MIQRTTIRHAGAGRRPTQRLASSRQRAHAQRRRGGMMIVYLIVILSMLFALASLAVDYGRVQLAKTQLQTATDSAVKWAALSAKGSKAELLARANDAAADNQVNGQTPVYADADLQIGRWNPATRTFTANAAPNNALRLAGTQVIPLMMGGVIQKPSVTIRVVAVAKRQSMAGMIGLNAIDVKNNLFVGSYDSSVTTNPTQQTAGSNAQVASNGLIQAGNNGAIMGDVSYGPAGSVDIDKWTVSGQTNHLGSAVIAPAEPAWNPTGNPGSIPQNYTHNGGTLNGGDYYFTTLNINGALSFSGPATLYVNGNIHIDGNKSDITAHANKPTNLTVYQIGANRTFTAENDFNMQGILIAPRSDFLAKNKVTYLGQMIAKTITLNNNASFFYDENGALLQAVELVQ